ncbi:MAG: endonuclease/exonuclease/phosphatase family protein [Planctomycetaceae bacterium]|nr:endonuclease/exonuclease/phosphatase family protein [Planctomycetaceae bacterium]
MKTDSEESVERNLSEEEAPPRERRRFWRLHLAIAILTIVGTALRLTIQDVVPVVATLFYATPISILFFGACWSGVVSWRQQGRFTAEWGLFAAILLFWWISTDWRRQESADVPENAAKVLFWNVARHDDLTRAADYLRTTDADIIGLVEVKGSAKDRRQFWNEQLPAYDVSILGGGIQLLTKGTSGEAVVHHLHRNSEARELQVTVRGNVITCFVVDIESDLIRSRKTALNNLAELANGHSGEPTLLMGDFNTPPESVHFRGLKAHHRLGFDGAGSGYRPTWPVPIPLLKLDQIWVNEQLELLECQQGWSIASDHRPIWVTVISKEDD